MSNLKVINKIFLLFLIGLFFINGVSAALANSTMLNDNFENGNLDFWTDNGASDWDFITTGYVSPTNSLECGTDDNDLLSDDLNMSNAQAIYINFSYYNNGIDANDDVILYSWDGTAYDVVLELGVQTGGNGTIFLQR